MLQATLAEPCGYRRKTSNKRRTYTVLHCQQSSIHMSLQQQQIQRQQQRQRNAPGDKAARTLASAEQHTVTNQSVQQVTENCGEDEDLKLTLIECKPTELAMDTLPCSSYPMYAYRPRGSSNSSQTTLTTSLGKLSLNEGNSCCRSELNVGATDNTKTSNGDCEEHSKISKTSQL